MSCGAGCIKILQFYYDPREANRYRDHETERLVEIVSPDYHELESHFGGDEL